jgi:hypothetical protein
MVFLHGQMCARQFLSQAFTLYSITVGISSNAIVCTGNGQEREVERRVS